MFLSCSGVHLAPLAGRALPHGTCPGVGVGGHIHGGFGLTGRNWGLTIDRIIEATVVLSNGSAVTASANKNPDLFFVGFIPCHCP